MAWRNIFVVGLLGSAAVIGCSVTTTNNNMGGVDDGGGATGGATGGSSNKDGGSGGSTGGKGGTGGTAGSSGAGGAATGGSGGGGDVCAIDSSDGGDGECSKCIKTTCCDFYKACGADSACGQSSTDDGEFLKFRACILGQYADSGVVNVDDCAAQAAADGVLVDFATRDLIACIRGGDAGTQPCSDKCFNTTL